MRLKEYERELDDKEEVRSEQSYGDCAYDPIGTSTREEKCQAISIVQKRLQAERFISSTINRCQTPKFQITDHLTN